LLSYLIQSRTHYLVVDARSNSVASLFETSQLRQHILVGCPHLEAVDAASAWLRWWWPFSRSTWLGAVEHGSRYHYDCPWTETKRTHVANVWPAAKTNSTANRYLSCWRWGGLMQLCMDLWNADVLQNKDLPRASLFTINGSRIKKEHLTRT